MKVAFEEFYREHYRLVAKFVFWQIGDSEEAKDIVQDIFCLAYEKWKTVSVHPCPAGWLLQVAKYKLLEFWREVEKQDVVPMEEEYEPGVNDENYDMVEIEAVATAKLKNEEWNLMKSYYWEHKDVGSLAQQAGVKNSCMRMRISRITKKLREVLKERG